MQTLSNEVLLTICQYLHPHDLGRLAKCGSRFMQLAQDEQLFSRLYERDFASLISDKPLDLVAAVQNLKPHKQQRARRKLLTIDMATTQAGITELQRMKNLKLEADWKWRYLYITLYLTRLNMYETMAERSGIEASTSFSHHAGGPNYRVMFYTIFDHEILQDPHASLLHHNTGIGLVDGSAPFKFEPLNFRFKGVGLKHFNFFHQASLIDEELGRRDADLDEFMGEDEDTSYGRGPPDGKIVLCQEGVAVWDAKSELYKLAYPMMALREIFLRCSAEIDVKTFDKQEAAREFLLETPVIICNVINSMLCQKYPNEVYQIIVDKLKEAELEVTACELVAPTCLKFTCRRAPKWKYTDGQCVHVEHGYKKETHTHYSTECLEPATKRSSPYGIPDIVYCAKHSAEHPRITKNQKRNRARCRTREYLNYPDRVNLKLVDCNVALQGSTLGLKWCGPSAQSASRLLQADKY
jgi:hypothetical protein